MELHHLAGAELLAIVLGAKSTATAVDQPAAYTPRRYF